jgi:hypothetical protein
VEKDRIMTEMNNIHVPNLPSIAMELELYEGLLVRYWWFSNWEDMINEIKWGTSCISEFL